ncbi:MAG TPA: MBL fold metallo-hydrolase [Haliangium sp.]|nr:MBL fold metallo-hydrolase [Haliangium sp.]
MRLRFWGVRGTFAACGAEFLRYGGNTTAVEFQARSGQRVLVDLGTGAAELAKSLMQGELGQGHGELPILLTHTHLDHIQGFPFFTPFFVRGNQIRILGAEPGTTSLEAVLQNKLDPHYSPLYGLENLAAGVTVETIASGDAFTIEGFDVRCVSLPHGNITTLAFRIEADGAAVVFATDVEYPDAEPTDAVLDLARGVDLLIHDAMFSDDDYQQRRGWGHSSMGTAIAVAERAGARRLALFHHHPDATDDALDAVIARARTTTTVPLFGAAEGAFLEL